MTVEKQAHAVKFFKLFFHIKTHTIKLMLYVITTKMKCKEIRSQNLMQMRFLISFVAEKCKNTQMTTLKCQENLNYMKKHHMLLLLLHSQHGLSKSCLLQKKFSFFSYFLLQQNSSNVQLCSSINTSIFFLFLFCVVHVCLESSKS